MANVTQPTMPATNSTLSKRRRFQPPITSFFPGPTGAFSDTHSVSHNHYSAATSSAIPVVPAKVQASLLSVGMRVRKSVADGYKTRMAMKDEKHSHTVVATDTSVVRAYPGTTGHTELAPFSGIPRTAYDQPFSTSYLATDDGDFYSLPPSSQESTTSTDSFSNVAKSHKRRLDMESYIFADDDLLDHDIASNTWKEAPLGRTILSPSLGQQRRRVLALQQKPSSTMDLDDFEEASFLRRREEVDADYHMDCA
ncbi:uncharacterized protein N7459_007660 [Penicillium hispanicum]|uniref:uncharacterized protein n=1 Tax=Penicillium hispanicum TaxID=1080232 RepID=UPI002541E4E6|nr:uncharacterized protein N7459_007660 [Penicillium hispanicum]KAJ5578696.1 hypothetical protein N7459_007660 [Penicillium hispanicum]